MQVSKKPACCLLCRICFLAEESDITEIRVKVLAKLRDATSLAQDMKHPFPLRPEIVIEIHQRFPTPSVLLEVVVPEMRPAALRGAVDMELYAERFQKYPASEYAVLKQEIADNIFAAWGRVAEDEAWEGDGRRVVVDTGKEAGWWKGPF